MVLLRRFCALPFFSLFLQSINAADLTIEHEPQGTLRVRLDWPLAKRSDEALESEHQWVFSSHITFNEDVKQISNGKLRGIAEDAYREMVADVNQYDPQERNKKGQLKSLPGAMTILAFGNEIILSSSQKGVPGFINEFQDSPVRIKLERCLIFWRDHVEPEIPPSVTTEEERAKFLDHKNQRGCGEIMALHQYYLTHNKDIATLEPRARMTTVTQRKKNGPIEPLPPCPKDMINRWGCDMFLQEFFGDDAIVDYFDKSVEREEYNLNQLAGGAPRIDQINMVPRS